MDLKYILRRYTFALEVRGIIPKIIQLREEFVSMVFNKNPINPRKIIWIGPKGDLIINYYASIMCWRHEFLDGEIYKIKLKNKKPIILDMGANQGFFTLYMKYNYPNSKIYAYEPIKVSFDMLIKNIEDNNLTDVEAFNSGVLDKNTTMTVYHRIGGAGLGDSIVPITYTPCIKEKCKLINPDAKFMKFKTIDLIKIDIEGSEFPLIKNCNFWKKADNLIIEFHDNVKNELGYENTDFIKIITDAGMKLVDKKGKGLVYVCHFRKGAY